MLFRSSGPPASKSYPTARHFLAVAQDTPHNSRATAGAAAALAVPADADADAGRPAAAAATAHSATASASNADVIVERFNSASSWAQFGYVPMASAWPDSNGSATT